MSTTKERAADLRRALKAAGYNARRVSVRVDYSSLSASVHVTVRDPEASLPEVERLAKRLVERIQRCEVTHEILGGGNTYVHVSYSPDAEEEIAARYSDVCEHAIREVLASTSRGLWRIEGVEASGKAFYLGHSHGAYGLWHDGTLIRVCNTPRDVALAIHRILDEKGGS